MRKIAVFDVDNTLVNGSSLYYLLWDLWWKKFINISDVLRFTKLQYEFRTRRTEADGAANLVAEMALGVVAGKTDKEVQTLIEPVARKIVQHHLIAETLQEVRALQIAGVEIWLASASPIEMVRALAHELGATRAIATDSRISNGFYTGELSGLSCHGFEKFRKVDAALNREGVSWNSVQAFSDSENDLPLLSAAKSAVVVNPNRRFEMIARKNGWRIIKPNPHVANQTNAIPHCELPPHARLKVRPGSDFST